MCLSEPGLVVEVDDQGRSATIELDGRRRTVSLAVLRVEGTPVDVGDWLLVHTGLAVTVLGPSEAEELAALHASLHATTDDGGREPPGKDDR